MTNWKIWKTIATGTYSNHKKLLAAIMSGGYGRTFRTDDIVTKTKLAKHPVPLELVRIAILELGIRHSSNYAEIREAGLARGLSLLPYETVPQLRLQYDEQPLSETVYVATKTVSLKGYRRAIFGVKHDDLGKRMIPIDARTYFKPTDVFVFAKK